MDEAGPCVSLVLASALQSARPDVLLNGARNAQLLFPNVYLFFSLSRVLEGRKAFQ